MKILTKSLYIAGLQCPRLLWYAARRELPEPTIEQLHRFEQGREFEKYAHKLFPGAVNLRDKNKKQEFTSRGPKMSLVSKKTVFESVATVDNLLILTDVLEPKKNGCNLYEIKATTEVKKQHYDDLAFQKYVCEKSGLNILKTFVIHLNKEYIKKGKINPKELCVIEDVSDKVNSIKNVEKNIEAFSKIMESKKAPDITISSNCNKPYTCALKDECWNTLPKDNVLHLTNWRQYWKFFQQGIIDIKDIPKNAKLAEKDKIIRKAVTSCKPVIDKKKIKEFLSDLKYPLYHLDFETFDTAVPIYDNSRPYQKIPFQYSLHIEQENGNTEHYEYLSLGKKDPRIDLLKQLKEEIKGKGSVIVFNKSFEIGVLQRLAEDFPKEAKWIKNVLSRIVDLAEVFKNFYYYCPTQKGKYSIKKVLPAITGKGYSELEINNGGEASAQYFNSFIKGSGDDNLKQDLLLYCGLDTEGMIWILDELKKLC